MDDLNKNINKMYLRINGEVTDREMVPPPPKQVKTKTFTINEDQLKKLEEWQSHIKAIYGSYGNYKYTFSSNGIGKNVVVYSELADTELDLTDVDSW